MSRHALMCVLLLCGMQSMYVQNAPSSFIKSSTQSLTEITIHKAVSGQVELYHRMPQILTSISSSVGTGRDTLKYGGLLKLQQPPKVQSTPSHTPKPLF